MFNILSPLSARKSLSFYIFLFIVSLFLGCEKKEDPASRPYPRLRTFPVEQTAEGTIFTGEVFYHTSSITDHGFIWTTFHEPSSGAAKGYKVSLGAKSGTGSFATTVTSTLQKEGRYTVKAYITSGQYTVFGTEIPFISKYGSLAPQIVSVQPQNVFLGDTISVIGKHFNYQTSSNKVWMDDIEASVIGSSDTALQVVVPGTLLKGASIKIKIITGAQSIVKENAFDLALPVINNFSPSAGGLGDKITIWGKNFHPQPEKNQVSIGDQPLLVKEVYPDRMVVALPKSSYSGISAIKVNVLEQLKESSSTFEWIGSQITDIQPRAVAYGDTVLITGKYLKDSHSPIVLYMGGGSMSTILEHTASHIKAIVPDYSQGRKIDVKFTFEYPQVSISAPLSLDLLPHTITKYTNTGKAGENFIIEGTNFSPLGYVNEVYLGDTMVEIVEGTPSKLVVRVPFGFTGNHTLKVSLTGLTVEAGDFTIVPFID